MHRRSWLRKDPISSSKTRPSKFYHVHVEMYRYLHEDNEVWRHVLSLFLFDVTHDHVCCRSWRQTRRSWRSDWEFWRKRRWRSRKSCRVWRTHVNNKCAISTTTTNNSNFKTRNFIASWSLSKPDHLTCVAAPYSSNIHLSCHLIFGLIFVDKSSFPREAGWGGKSCLAQRMRRPSRASLSPIR